MVPKPKKQATKGSKQIIEENEQTIKFYKIMSSIVTIAYYAVMMIFFINDFTTTVIVLSILTTAIHICCYNLLRYAAKVTYNDQGKVIDCGTDLNMEGGIAEHVKDVIILTTGTQMLSLLSNYFWFLLLLAPCRAMLILWKSVLAPWFFQPNMKPEVDEEKKKQKKIRYA